MMDRARFHHQHQGCMTRHPTVLQVVLPAQQRGPCIMAAARIHRLRRKRGGNTHRFSVRVCGPLRQGVAGERGLLMRLHK